MLQTFFEGTVKAPSRSLTGNSGGCVVALLLGTGFESM